MISSAAVLLLTSHNHTEVMASKNQYLHAEKYKSSEIEGYTQKTEKVPEMVAFLFPTIEEFCKSYIPYKTVLDTYYLWKGSLYQQSSPVWSQECLCI